MGKDGMTLLGSRELERVFKTLGDRVQRKVTRQAVNVAATPVVRAARSKAPQQSGLLKKSLGKKIKTYKRAGTVVGLVGPRTDVQGEYQGEKRVPWRYAHLVEDGHVDAKGNPIPAQPFLRPAFDETQGQALDTMSTKLGEGVTREAMKAAKGAA